MTLFEQAVAWVKICHAHGVRHAIISPGSRPAPLTVAFARYDGIQKWVIPDERSAAFVALGMAKNLKQPVALLCTSGSAGLNYLPAVAEAYFSGVPLLLLTADRPPEWVDQQDGQTIRQSGMFGKHVKAAFDLPASPTHYDEVWHAQRLFNQALQTCVQTKAGPVHLNIPFREPFYPPSHQVDFREINPNVFQSISPEPTIGFLPEICYHSKKVLFIIAQQNQATEEEKKLLSILDQQGWPVVTEIGSQIGLENGILHQDLFCRPNDQEFIHQYAPELVITMGEFILSKNLKQFLRQVETLKHLHIGLEPVDILKKLELHLNVSKASFLKQFTELAPGNDQLEFTKKWRAINQSTELRLKEYGNSNEVFNELAVMYQLWQNIPKGSAIVLANSMPVRYANFIGNRYENHFEIVTNRGTSGIDGTNSTALGHALAHPDQMVWLITGDMAFLYDRNAFWHNYHPANLKIVVINNQGGGIFHLLPEASVLPELNDYFVTKQTNRAEHTAVEFEMKYFAASDYATLAEGLAWVKQARKQISLLEVFVPAVVSVQAFKKFKSSLND